MGAVIAASIAAVIALVGVGLQVLFANRDQNKQLKFQGAQDKRTVYAAALAALRRYSIERGEDTETAARIAVATVELVAPDEVFKPAHVVLTEMCDAKSGDRAWSDMVQRMREDLGADPPPSKGWFHI